MPKDETEDDEIMRRLAEAETGALRDLYRRYGSLVYGVALRVTGDEAAAEEVSQDVFLRAWRGASGYRRERGSVAAWLGRIARNRAVDALRSRESRGRVTDDGWADISETADTRSPDPAEAASRELRAREVRAAVAELPEPQRRVLSLAFFGGMSHSEIAASLALPLGTVKSRIRDALHNLRGRLADLDGS